MSETAVKLMYNDLFASLAVWMLSLTLGSEPGSLVSVASILTRVGNARQTVSKADAKGCPVMCHLWLDTLRMLL